MLNDTKNFIKWLVLKVLIINKVNNATKFESFFVFLYESYFFLQGSIITIKLPCVITYVCQKFGVHEVHGLLPKNIY